MLGFIGKLGLSELLWLVTIVLIIMGPNKLTQVGEFIDRAVDNFRNSKDSNFKKLE